MKKEKQIGIRLEAEMVERATKKARAEQRNLSQVVRILLADWLKKPAKKAA